MRRQPKVLDVSETSDGLTLALSALKAVLERPTRVALCAVLDGAGPRELEALTNAASQLQQAGHYLSLVVAANVGAAGPQFDWRADDRAAVPIGGELNGVPYEGHLYRKPMPVAEMLNQSTHGLPRQKYSKFMFSPKDLPDVDTVVLLDPVAIRSIDMMALSECVDAVSISEFAWAGYGGVSARTKIHGTRMSDDDALALAADVNAVVVRAQVNAALGGVYADNDLTGIAGLTHALVSAFPGVVLPGHPRHAPPLPTEALNQRRHTLLKGASWPRQVEGLSAITALGTDPKYLIKFEEAAAGLIAQRPGVPVQWCLQVDGPLGRRDEAAVMAIVEKARNAGIEVSMAFNEAPSMVAATRNRALVRAKYSVMVTMDSDDLLNPEALKMVVEHFDASPDAGCLLGASREWQPDSHGVYQAPDWHPMPDASVEIFDGENVDRLIDKLGDPVIVMRTALARLHGGWAAQTLYEDFSLAAAAMGTSDAVIVPGVPMRAYRKGHESDTQDQRTPVRQNLVTSRMNDAQPLAERVVGPGTGARPTTRWL